jgi:hypothetical protein
MIIQSIARLQADITNFFLMKRNKSRTKACCPCRRTAGLQTQRTAARPYATIVGNQIEKMKIISTIILVLSAQMGIACSCGTTLIDLPIKEMGWTQTETEGISSMSDIIFTGVLIDERKVEESYQSLLFYETKETKYELIFKLIKSYKGDQNDTIKIRTNNGSDACGFGAKKNTECLIFGAKGQSGYYYTYRSDCCKSISKEEDEKRYNKYVKFLESITNMIDGEYIFFQSRGYWRGGYQDVSDTLEAIRYNIKNGKLEGTWQIKDRKGRVLEKGEYKNGQKTGTWKVNSYTESDLKDADEQIKIEKTKYQNGLPRKSVTTIEDKIVVWEEPFHSQIIRKQKIKKKYKQFNIEK